MPRGRDLILVIGTGVIWFAGYNLSLNAAEQVVDAGTAAMLVFIGPLLVILLAGVFLGEGFPRRVVLGAAVAFSGILIPSTVGSSASTGTAASAVQYRSRSRCKPSDHGGIDTAESVTEYHTPDPPLCSVRGS